MKPDLHLLIDKEQLEIAEKMMRGGVSSIYEQQLLQTNNCHFPNYDASKPYTYVFMLDANNLYGGILQTDRLSVKYFALDAHITLDETLKIS